MIQVRRQPRRRFLQSPDISPYLTVGELFQFPAITGTLTARAFVGPRYRLYFYEQSTTTDKPVYSEPVLVISHANPVVCDRHGNLPTIYLTPGETYTFVIKNDHNVFLYEEDI